MFAKRKAAKLALAQQLEAREEARAMAAVLPDAEGHVPLDGFQEFFQFVIDHDISLLDIPGEWREVRLGLAASGYFIGIDSTLLTKSDEDVLFETGAELLKEVTDREFVGGSAGVSVPIRHGVRVRGGGVRGHMIKIGSHWESADSGRLTVTEHRIVYHGGRKNLEFPFAKLATLNLYTDAIDLGVTSRQSVSSFRVPDPQLTAGLIRAAFDQQDGEVTIIKMTARD